MMYNSIGGNDYEFIDWSSLILPATRSILKTDAPARFSTERPVWMSLDYDALIQNPN
jgi:hypothetical protein